MPKERIRKSGRDGWADLLVQWGPEELGLDQRVVRLFIIAAELGPAGAFMFHPERPEEIGIESGSSIGPIDIKFDRDQLNRLITVLRRARDKTYGRDA